MTKTVEELAAAIRKIDFGMLSTITEGGEISSRPMSNNGEVDYDGTSYFFAYDDTLMVADIVDRPQVGLTFSGASGLLGLSPFFVAIEGEARLVRDRDAFAARWHSDLDRWFEHGVDTPGLVMIEVAGRRMHYWDGGEDGELVL